MPRRDRPVTLVADQRVEMLSATSFHALAGEPWLRLDLPGPVPAGRWVRMRYRTGRFDDPVRPLLGIDLVGGTREEMILPGPVCGAAIWVGKLPPSACGLSISPVVEAGPFSFSLDGFETLSRVGLVLGALRRKPGLTLEALYTRLSGKKVRARHVIASIWGSVPFGRYRRWLDERETSRWPPCALSRDGSGSPPIVLLVEDGLIEAGLGRRGRLDRTLRSVEAQDPGTCRAVSLASEVADPGREAVRMGADWIGRLAAGDILSPDAAACLLAAAARRPEAAILYSDDDGLDAGGRRTEPRLKPDWSPRLNAEAPYLDGLTLIRAAAFAALCEPGMRFDDVLSKLVERRDGTVAHVRRILLHRRAGGNPGKTPARPDSPVVAENRPGVSIVVPNRDRLDLIEPCMTGLLTRTAYDDLEIVVVDNGSEATETRVYYDRLVQDRRVTILDRPGPFNYSALVNAGVAASRGEVLLLLNNDIEVIGPDWLGLMIAELRPADVGAVGAKLLYPDGRLQHGGVVVGLDKYAGHLYRGRPGDTVGWMSRLDVPHEVSAVTGACLAVARAKFEAVGGLDERLLPISFNDIDLCLKLRRAGLRNIMASNAVLYHHESASRGRDVGEKQARAEREARVFASRWREVMRDDPYFHPGLSQLRFDLSLG